MDNDVNVGVFGECMMGAGRARRRRRFFVGTGIARRRIGGSSSRFSKLAGELGTLSSIRRPCAAAASADASRPTPPAGDLPRDRRVGEGRKKTSSRTDPKNITTKMMIDALNRRQLRREAIRRRCVTRIAWRRSRTSLVRDVHHRGGIVDALDAT